VGPKGEVLHVNGKSTLGENLADNGGLARAYEAWKSERVAVGGGKRNPKLPGLQQMTEEQLFFVG
jgi:endothelin-converting enzyme